MKHSSFDIEEDPGATHPPLQQAAGVPRRLRDTGLDRALIPAIAEDTLRDRGLYFNPRRTESADAIRQLMEEAW